MASQAELAQRVEAFEGNKDPFISTAIRNIASAMVEQAAKVHQGQNVLIWFDEPGMQLVKEMNLRCVAKGASVNFFMRDYDQDARVIPTLNEEGIRHYFDEEASLMDQADVVLLVRGPENPEAMKDVPPPLMEAYDKRYTQVHQRRIDGTVDWTLIFWPTQYEADKENLPYDEYFKIYMEACNQPWEAIKEAQAKLISKLNHGKKLQLIADEDNPDPKKRTNITMSIDGMTFANSTVDLNYPGSEVFSAPVLDSVNGQIYAEGEYLYNSKLMKNIYFRVENGVIVEAHAEEGDAGLQEILSRGEGARKFGEVALGTNPGLTRRFFNDLLKEKVGGSFHMAIGHCLEFKEYAGLPVNVNNGNTEEKTPNHWDLTILMHRKPDGTGGGKVILDDQVIQQDGVFLDPELSILSPKLN
ncbi:MAG: aminopeptidase [Patescibacteria group bacterium]|nr:aminopeptidase [Patescibacteria group bacterium]